MLGADHDAEPGPARDACVAHREQAGAEREAADAREPAGRVAIHQRGQRGLVHLGREAARQPAAAKARTGPIAERPRASAPASASRPPAGRR